MPCRDHKKPQRNLRLFAAPKGYYPPAPPGDGGRTPRDPLSSWQPPAFCVPSQGILLNPLGPPFRGRICPATRGDPGRDHAKPSLFAPVWVDLCRFGIKSNPVCSRLYADVAQVRKKGRDLRQQITWKADLRRRTPTSSRDLRQREGKMSMACASESPALVLVCRY